MSFRVERSARFGSWVGMTALMFVLAVRSLAGAQSSPPEEPGTREGSDSETDERETSEQRAWERAVRELYEECPALREFGENMDRAIVARGREPESPRFAVDLRLDPLAEHGFRLHLEITVDERTQIVREENERCEPLLELALRHIQQIGVAPTGVSAELLLLPFVDVGSTPAVTAGPRLALQLRIGPGSLILAADLLIPRTGAIQGTGGSITATTLSLGVLGCGRPLAGDVSLDLCGGLHTGAVLAYFDGIDVPKDVSFFLAADAGVLLGVRLLEWASLLVSADLLVPLIRPVYDVTGATRAVTAGEVVAGRFAIGLAIRL